MGALTTAFNDLVTPAGTLVTAALGVVILFLGAKVGIRAIRGIA